jgi:hypothetical protein
MILPLTPGLIQDNKSTISIWIDKQYQGKDVADCREFLSSWLPFLIPVSRHLLAKVGDTPFAASRRILPGAF